MLAPEAAAVAQGPHVVAHRAMVWDRPRLRAWLDALLRRGVAGSSVARTTLQSWAAAMVPADNADVSLRLRGLDDDVAVLDREALSPLTRAYLRVTCAPSRARRLPPSARRHEHTDESHWYWRSILSPMTLMQWRDVIVPNQGFLGAAMWEHVTPGLAESDPEAFLLDVYQAWKQHREEAPKPPRELMRIRFVCNPPVFRRGRREAVHHGSLAVRRRVLAQPGLAVRDVVEMAALRPTRAGLLLAIAQEPRWFRHAPIRQALVANPYTPSWLVAALLPITPHGQWRSIAAAHDDPGVATLVKALRHSRAPRPAHDEHGSDCR